MSRHALLMVGLLFGLAGQGAAARREPGDGVRVPYAGRTRGAAGLAAAADLSATSYDCSHEQSGVFGVNPCTGNPISEITRVACRGTLSVRPDGIVIDAHYNTSVRGLWKDEVTGERFLLTGSGVVAFADTAAADLLTLTAQFRGRARGKHYDIGADWDGIIHFGPNFEVLAEAGVPKNSFSESLTCLKTR